DMTIEDLHAEQVRCETKSGEIVFKDEILKSNLDLTTVSGDLAIIFNQMPDSMKLDFQTLSGKQNIGFEGLNLEEQESNRFIGSTGNGNYEIKVRSKSGRITLK